MVRHSLKVALIVCSCLIFASCAARKPFVAHDAMGPQTPWQHLNFRNDPKQFQFAIVADRSGGSRPGVFEAAIEKINLLQPDFVLSVGDFIAGYTEDTTEIVRQWGEFDSLARGFSMPFFRVPGNHDVTNRAQAKIWEKRYGKRYYSFVYKDVLFLCMDSQDRPLLEGIDSEKGGFGAQQLTWAKEVLKSSPKVRWTFVFFHQPLWVEEEGHFTSSRKNFDEPRATGFGELEGALQGRPYTVFTGHYHQYASFSRKGMKYFILSTSGGGNQLRGTAMGEFDHVVMASVKSGGPYFTNLMIDGIRDENVATEAMMRFNGETRLAKGNDSANSKGFSMVLPIANPFGNEMSVSYKWAGPAESPWKIEPSSGSAKIGKGDTLRLEFKAVPHGGEFLGKFPLCSLYCDAGPKFRASLGLPFPTRDLVKSLLPQAVALHMKKAPVIDGKLNESAWKNAAVLPKLGRQKMDGPISAPTEVKVGWDSLNFYLAVRCTEPLMDKLVTAATKQDGPVWDDDSFEFFLQSGPERDQYHQFVVSAAGTVFDAAWGKIEWNGDFQRAVGKEKGAWILEAAVPWSTLGFKAAPADSTVRFNAYRNRIQAGHEIQMWAPDLGEIRSASLFGKLLFATEAPAAKAK